MSFRGVNLNGETRFVGDDALRALFSKQAQKRIKDAVLQSGSCNEARMSWGMRIVDPVHKSSCTRLETVTTSYLVMLIEGAGVFVTASLTLS
jgi:hypothetical protein